MLSKLTICSVFYSPESKKIWKQNYRLVAKLNPDTKFYWILVDNSGNSPKKIEKKGVITILPGFNQNINIHQNIRNSYHHGQALNKAIKLVKTPFLLILDYDFFIIKPDWVLKILDNMEKNNLAFLGAPWHPRWYNKIRYFPNSHCLFINLQKVKKEQLDFLPIHSKKSGEIYLPPSYNMLIRYFYVLLRMISFKDREAIGKSKDTGFKIYKKFFLRKNYKTELFIPYFNINKDFRGPSYAKTKLLRLFEKLLPEDYSFFPQAKNYFRVSGFDKFGLTPIHNLVAEEFFWNDKPFGFHLRSTNRKKSIKKDIRNINKSVKGLNVLS